MSRTLALLTPCFFVGCAVHDESPIYTDTQRISPNGNSLTGITLDARHPASVTLNGVAPTGVAASGRPISIAAEGPPLSGAALVGSRWTGHLSDGSNLTLRIDAAAQGAGVNDDIWSYQVSALAGTTWRPVCLDAIGNAGFADSVRGTWNLAQGVPGGGAFHPRASDFTFACRGSAAAKCVELGYKPWDGAERELATCVRALRADFCGDGKSYTVDGTLVNIYDTDGMLPDSVAWTVEAEWTPEGARCVSSKDATRFAQAAHETPGCFLRSFKTASSCGNGRRGGIITELPPRGASPGSVDGAISELPRH